MSPAAAVPEGRPPGESPRAAESLVPLRLRGTIAGVERSFLLRPGSQTVGAHPECDLVLPVPGVSRRHALLRTAEESVEVADLTSRNGTFVGDHRLGEGDRIPLVPGTTLRLGPVELILEQVPAADAELAFLLPAADGAEGGGIAAPWRVTASTTLATRTGGPPAEDAARAHRALGEMAEHLLLRQSGEEALAEALAAFSRTLELTSLQLSVRPVPTRDTPGSARVLASWGAVEREGEAAEIEASLLSALEAGEELYFRPGPNPEGGFLRALAGLVRSGRLYALVVRGLPPRPDVRALLTGVLRLASAHCLQDGDPEELLPAPEPASTLRFPPDIVVSRNDRMQRVYGTLAAAARSSSRILLQGETGVGKEHLARAVHLTSERRDGPWIALNCAAIPADLLEAELFGIERGVATGVEPREGAFVQAHGGTLFLDEVGELAPELQAKLLRVLEEGEVRPVGGSPEAVDVRIVSATNADLEARIEEGLFRTDLFYRLAGLRVRVPPLRERREDVPPLIGHFLRLHGEEAARAGHPVLGLSTGALEALTHRSWPGNVRQLESEIRRLVWACEPGQVIDTRLLETEPGSRPESPTAPEASDDLDLRRHVRALEKRVIAEALRRTGGSQRQAAKLLGIARNTLAEKIRRLEIDPEGRSG